MKVPKSITLCLLSCPTVNMYSDGNVNKSPQVERTVCILYSIFLMLYTLYALRSTLNAVKVKKYDTSYIYLVCRCWALSVDRRGGIGLYSRYITNGNDLKKRGGKHSRHLGISLWPFSSFNANIKMEYFPAHWRAKSAYYGWPFAVIPLSIYLFFSSHSPFIDS